VDDLQPHSTGGRRKARLESFLRREIATTVTTELRDPRIGFVTITRCELSPDNSDEQERKRQEMDDLIRQARASDPDAGDDHDQK